GATVGVRGEVVSPANNSAGVYGSAESNTGDSYGVWGVTNSTTATAGGMYGQNANTTTSTGTLTGVRGGVSSTIAGPVARGVFGTVGNANANSAGVMGTTTAAVGSGVLGEVASIGAFGVQGRNTSTAPGGTPTGVLGTVANTTGTSRTSAARGVSGSATGATGSSYGVYGESASSATGLSGAAGVSGFSSSGAAGVMGVSGVTAGGSATSGRVPAGGLFGYTSNSDGNAGYFLGRVVIENQSGNGSQTSGTDPFIVWAQTNGAAGVNSQAQMFANAFNPTSDRDKKTAFQTVDAHAVLGKVVALPLTTWRFKTEDPAVRHMGVMAQDFHAAFGLNGDKDRTITTTDMDGVLVASVQGLHELIMEQRATISRLESELVGVRGDLERTRTLFNSGPGWIVALAGGSLIGGLLLSRRRR
ncbi:MAG: hypothetical protein FJ255_12690, partial [Phycisphaerae bacterium]|nr:hypothetical protein [Phycisphaerae bacterium]